jgi:hypothetical protein
VGIGHAAALVAYSKANDLIVNNPAFKEKYDKVLTSL